MKCHKCNRKIFRCPTCKGEGAVWGGLSSVRCNRCNETGYQCPAHGKFWTR